MLLTDVETECCQGEVGYQSPTIIKRKSRELTAHSTAAESMLGLL